MKNEQFVFWILSSVKYLSFQPIAGYTPVISDTWEKMWEQIHLYIDTGYKVG